ncbi:hypothetical protein AB0J42_17290 [Nonomuraea sp. NPDC049649]|uniref:hypothetical protein n=1 Tax=Nonomuraea sp. NPDC049649 TaxID=3155776 RepID=UPI00342CEA5C
MTVGIEGADIEERPAGHRRAALVALSVGGFGIGLTEFVAPPTCSDAGGSSWPASSCSASPHSPAGSPRNRP